MIQSTYEIIFDFPLEDFSSNHKIQFVDWAVPGLSSQSLNNNSNLITKSPESKALVVW